MSQYHTIYDIAELLQCSDDQVRKLIAAGELATISLSMPGSKRNCVRISQHQLDAFLAARILYHPDAHSFHGKRFPENSPKLLNSGSLK